MITNEEKNIALLTHLLGIFTGWLGPLIMYVVKKDESGEFLKEHLKESLNFQISYLIITLVCLVTIIGWIMLPVMFVLFYYGTINAAIKASNGENYKYPWTFRLIK